MVAKSRRIDRHQEETPLVVLAEDGAAMRLDISAYLREEGFRPVEASDTDEALTLLQTRSDVRALVTDAHLPGSVDGWQLAGIVRERWPKVGVVMMSGHSDATSGDLPAGSEFVAKPYLFEHLASTLRRLLAGGATEAGP